MQLRSGWISIDGADGFKSTIPYQRVAGSMRKHQILSQEPTQVAVRRRECTGRSPDHADKKDVVIRLDKERTAEMWPFWATIN